MSSPASRTCFNLFVYLHIEASEDGGLWRTVLCVLRGNMSAFFPELARLVVYPAAVLEYEKVAEMHGRSVYILALALFRLTTQCLSVFEQARRVGKVYWRLVRYVDELRKYNNGNCTSSDMRTQRRRLSPGIGKKICVRTCITAVNADIHHLIVVVPRRLRIM